MFTRLVGALVLAPALALPGGPVVAGPGGGVCNAAWAAAQRAKQVPPGQTQAQFLASCAVGMSVLSRTLPATPLPPVTAVPPPVVIQPARKAAVARRSPLVVLPPTASLLPAYPRMSPATRGAAQGILPPTSSLLPAYPTFRAVPGQAVRAPGPVRGPKVNQRRRGG